VKPIRNIEKYGLPELNYGATVSGVSKGTILIPKRVPVVSIDGMRSIDNNNPLNVSDVLLEGNIGKVEFEQCRGTFKLSDFKKQKFKRASREPLY
jgi:hypothetical protein